MASERWSDRKWPDRYDRKAASLAGTFKEPDHFWTSDMKLVEDALREEAAEAQLRLIDEYSKRARSLDGDLMGELRARIEKEGPL